MEELLTIEWRGIERLMVVGFGGLSIYLGYLLFIKVPTYKDADGKVTIPGGIVVVLTRVGPGVFFALFGSVILSVSLAFGVVIHGPQGRLQDALPVSQDHQGRISYSVAMPTIPDGDDVETVRNHAVSDVRALVEAQDILERCISEGGQDIAAWRLKNIRNALGRSKTMLMRGVWNEDWGEQKAFLDWLKEGEAEPIPTGISAAVAVYRSGKPLIVEGG